MDSNSAFNSTTTLGVIMSKSAYDIGYEDGYNGRERKDEDTLGKLFMDVALPGSSSLIDDFDYDAYNRGYDDGVAAAEKD